MLLPDCLAKADTALEQTLSTGLGAPFAACAMLRLRQPVSRLAGVAAAPLRPELCVSAAAPASSLSAGSFFHRGGGDERGETGLG
eukprot:SAG22_NODE_4983_length_1115_cov_8.806102_2_plen_84_part_01